MKKYSFICAILALGLSTPAIAAPVQWTSAAGGNDHWYELVNPAKTGKMNWSMANNMASASNHDGETGYLATITSAGEQSFLNNFVNTSFIKAWLGGSDAASEGSWGWASHPGDSFAYTNWSAAANTNGKANKDHLAGWMDGDKWRDCRNNWDQCSIFRYVVEYDEASGAQVSAVPVPASLPLIAGGLGMMAFFGRRARKSDKKS